MRIVLSAVLSVTLLCACATAVPKVPANAVVGVHAPGAALSASVEAPPQIVSMAFNTLDIARGASWSGDFITSTNVASLEVRSNLFSLNVPRTAFGRFHFTVDVYDLPPIFIRAYRVRVIARNTAGLEAEEDVPFRIR